MKFNALRFATIAGLLTVALVLIAHAFSPQVAVGCFVAGSAIATAKFSVPTFGVMPNLLDIVKQNEGVGFDLIEENILLAPELRIIPAEPMAGTDMKLTVRTDLPTVAFRNLGEGVARSKNKYETRVFSTADLSGQVAMDLGIYRRALNKPNVLANEASGFIEAAFRHVGKQFYYGTTNDAKGFPGIIAQMLSELEVDATGSTAKSSAFMVRIGRETTQFLIGNEGSFGLLPQWKEETLYDANTNPYQGIANWFNGAIGCRVANKKSIVRIKNLGTDTGKGLTDNLLYEAYEKFTTALGAEPTHIFLTPRSREQLRKSRTNTGSNQKGEVPSLPNDWNGIPLVGTSAISHAETI